MSDLTGPKPVSLKIFSGGLDTSRAGKASAPSQGTQPALGQGQSPAATGRPSPNLRRDIEKGHPERGVVGSIYRTPSSRAEDPVAFEKMKAVREAFEELKKVDPVLAAFDEILLKPKHGDKV